MSSQTNSILRYVRPQSVWLCPDCDAENELTESSCFLCGCGKTVTAVVIHPVDNFNFKEKDVPAANKTSSGKKSTISPARGYTTPPLSETTGTGTISSGGLEALEYTVPAEKKRNPVATILIALLITLGLALLGFLIFLSVNFNVSSKDYYIENQYYNYDSTEITDYNNTPEFFIENQ